MHVISAYVYSIGASLNIYTTTLHSLDLTRLKHIKSKRIFVVDNKDLCYAETVNWRKIVLDDSQHIKVYGNKNSSSCRKCFHGYPLIMYTINFLLYQMATCCDDYKKIIIL